MSKYSAANWRGRETALQNKAQKDVDEKGQDHPDSRASYRELEDHISEKPMRLWGRR